MKLWIYTLCRCFTYYMNSWPCQIPLHRPYKIFMTDDINVRLLCSYFIFHTEVVVLDALLTIWSFPTSVSFSWGGDFCDAPDNYFTSGGKTKSPVFCVDGVFMKSVCVGGGRQEKLWVIIIKEIWFQVFFRRSTDAYVKSEWLYQTIRKISSWF